MHWIRRQRPSPATAIALAALFVALGGVAYATIPDSNGTIHGCYQKPRGDLRVVESAGDCRSREGALDWNQKGPTGATGPQGSPGESSNVKVFRSLLLRPGETQNLLQAGSLTFTARCGPAVPPQTGVTAGIDLTTSQDHAAFYVDRNGLNDDLLAGQTATLAVLTDSPPRIAEVQFTATSPDRTVVTGMLSLGINLGNDAGKCLFGGFAAISQ